MNEKEKEELMNQVFSKNRGYSSINDESREILEKTKAQLDEFKKASFSNNKNVDYDTLKKDIEKDFNIKVDTPEVFLNNDNIDEILNKIKEELNKIVFKQEEAINNLIISYKRPYLVGTSYNKIRNTILLSGPKGSGKHLLINEFNKLLKENKVLTNDSVISIDMSKYESSSEEIIFLQDLFVALNSDSQSIIIENFENSNPIFIKMLTDLCMNGSLYLNKRYSFDGKQLSEVSTLSKNTVDTLDGNNKIIYLVTELKVNKLLNTFGKNFIDYIQDKIITNSLDDKTIDLIINNKVNELKEDIKKHLNIDTLIDTTFNSYVRNNYEMTSGADSLTPVITVIYTSIVNLKLKDNSINKIKIAYEDDVVVYVGEEKVILNLKDDDSLRQEVQKELDSIIGLQEVKDKLLEFENEVKVNKLRSQKGLKNSDVSKHMIFTGNPGTGKTTIARVVSKMMKAAGILSTGQLVEVDRSKLVGQYVGHTAPIVSNVVKSALGGVLFIDEAYSLYRGKDDSFGLEAIDTLVKLMEDYRDDLIVILAGYSKEMEEFLNANSGLKSRFPNIINFKDYTAKEMVEIAKSIAKSSDYKIDVQALKKLESYFEVTQSKNDATSGNGRLARNVVEKAILKQGQRIINDPSADINLLLVDDFNL